MKSPLLLLVIALVLSLPGKAQTQQGSLMPGGNGSASYDNGFLISLLPNAGYFVIDNLAVGSGFQFSYSNRENNRFVSRGVQPFARYYFGQESRTRLFTQLSAAVSTSRHFVTMYFSDNQERDMTLYFNENYFGGGLGVTHFISEHVGLEAHTFYNNLKTGTVPRRNRFGLMFGVQVYLPRR